METSKPFKFGDYVTFTRCADTIETGRFVRYANKDRRTAFVCFTSGCTASHCSTAQLRLKEPTEYDKTVAYGYHRFDDDCPEFDPVVCSLDCLRFSKTEGGNCEC